MMSVMKMKTLAVRSSVAIACVVSLVGIAHAPFARSFLMKVGGCPAGQASAAGVENARMVGVRATRGSERAPARPALGFTLDVTTKDEVLAWAKDHKLECTTAVQGMKLTCKDVPAGALEGRNPSLGPVGVLTLAFRPNGERLVNLSAVTTGLSPEDAARSATHTGERLVAALGAPESGEARVDATHLAKGGYATSHLAFRFADYMSEVTATSVDGRGVLVREHYISAAD